MWPECFSEAEALNICIRERHNLMGAFASGAARGLSVMVLLNGSLRAQDTVRVDGVKVAALGAVVAGSVAAVHVYQMHAWWQGPRAPFRFENDWDYALNIDKMGHAYAAYFLSSAFAASLSWAGFSERTALFLGPVLGLSYQMYVEVEDGFHQEYGFSPGDGLSNITGAMLFCLRSSIPVLENFCYKYSYWPSRQYLDDVRSGQPRAFFDDYEGTSFWLGMDPHFFLGEGPRRVLPPWLGVGVGLAVRDLDGLGHGDRVIMIALDLNFRRITTSSDLLRTVFHLLDFFHIPAPGLQIRRGMIQFGVY